MQTERYKKGYELYKKLHGEHAGKDIVDAFKDVSPEMEKFTMEFGFGDIFSRQGLDIKTRELCTISALTALGFAEPQLKAHVGAALTAGATPTEIKEVILQMLVYTGFPAAINAMLAAKDVLESSVGPHGHTFAD